jgi:hypothetical protein
MTFGRRSLQQTIPSPGLERTESWSSIDAASMRQLRITRSAVISQCEERQGKRPLSVSRCKTYKTAQRYRTLSLFPLTASGRFDFCRLIFFSLS